MKQRPVDRLIRLLDEERAALIAGDLEKVVGMVGEKQKLADELETSRAVDLRFLSDRIDSNGRLLAAARDGVSDVVQTLKNHRQARTSLSSYDSSGKATTITGAPAKTERRY